MPLCQEASGAWAEDSSGQGYRGSISGEPIRVPGWLGTALQFDGVDDAVTIPDAPALRMTGEFGLALWVRLAAVPATGRVLLAGKGDSTAQR